MTNRYHLNDVRLTSTEQSEERWECGIIPGGSHSFFFFFKIQLHELVPKGETQKEIFHSLFTPRWAQCPSQEPGIPPGSSYGWQGDKYLGHVPLLSRAH